MKLSKIRPCQKSPPVRSRAFFLESLLQYLLGNNFFNTPNNNRLLEKINPSVLVNLMVSFCWKLSLAVGQLHSNIL